MFFLTFGSTLFASVLPPFYLFAREQTSIFHFSVFLVEQAVLELKAYICRKHWCVYEA